MLAIVNFKAYKTSTGVHAIKLAKICEKVARKQKVQVAVAVQPCDIFQVAANVKIPVLAQHVDPVDFGAHSGWILPESALQAGAIGSLINHSEHQIPMEYIKATVDRLKKIGMLTICCAATPAKAVNVAKFKPDIVAIEPPELIGGDISVSTAKPEVITKTTKQIKSIPVLCGAGIKTKRDVSQAVELGAKGILVASGITKARNPELALTQLVRGLK
jgi:triosephosphate isomerase